MSSIAVTAVERGWTPLGKSRLAAILYVRGFLLLALGAIGVRWPQQSLASVITIAGITLSLLGAIEATLAIFSRANKQTASLLRYIAFVSLAFGLVSLSVRTSAPTTTVAILATWLVAHATVAVMVGAVLRRPFDRRAVLAWSVVNVAAALIVAAASDSAFQILLYAGAAYVALYGIAQIIVGLRLRADATGFLSVSPGR